LNRILYSGAKGNAGTAAKAPKILLILAQPGGCIETFYPIHHENICFQIDISAATFYQ
jgi:hypothetical protein